MATVLTESANRLLQRFRSLPAAAPLLGALRGLSGVHLVGGAVRDLILDRGDPPDLDFIVEGEPGEVVARLGSPIRAYDRFGTCTLQLAGFRYDFARARSETYARPGALPTVAPASLAQDLERRDFTVNAAALAVAGSAAGTLLAVDAAKADLRGRLLRVLHGSSFLDDPTRLLRLSRYASRLSFAIEPQTAALAQTAIESGALETVSGARKGAELRLLAHEPDPVAALAQLRSLELDAALGPGFGLRDEALARRALELLPADGDRGALVLAAASIVVDPETDAAHPGLARWLDELAFAAGERDTIVAAASGARALACELASAERPSEIAAAVGRAGPELVALAGALGPERAARNWLSRLRQIRLEIDGDDLLHAGVAPGPAVGAGLRAALAAKLDGRAADRAAELREALGAAAGGG
jgi:tRNA nucleotidyltransferase (CCA-adding enzyme)